jgi:hypothetical protein
MALPFGELRNDGTLQGVRGLIGNPDNYAQIAYERLKRLTLQRRVVKLQKILSASGVRWPVRKAAFLPAGK